MTTRKAASYIVIGKHSWNRDAFEKTFGDKKNWRFLSEKKEFDVANLDRINPRYLFFLHWSDWVPTEILERFECVCFHMTDVPYGRGGSPLQNLIAHGHRTTMLTALRMVEAFDAGPVYMKRPLSLEGSSAEEIFQRASRLSLDMIKEIVATQPTPVLQTGNPTIFKRRKPSESALPVAVEELLQIHDFIRMLDADGYPPAFLEAGRLRLEFKRSTLYGNRVEANVSIRLKPQKPRSEEGI